MLLSAAAAEPHRSWAWLIALGTAYVIFRVGTYVWTTMIKNHSPTPAITGAKRVKVQSTVGVNTNRTDRTDVHDWGAISHEQRQPIRPPAVAKPVPAPPKQSLLDRMKHVFATGDSPPPVVEDVPDDELQDDLDVALDGEPAATVSTGEAAQKYIADARRAGVPYGHMVRVLREQHGLSVDQAKYQLRKASDARKAQPPAA